ncbi:MAG: TRAP transporter large permease [Qingshengfaniella sp.]
MTVMLILLLLVALMALGLPIAWCFAAVLAVLTLIFDTNIDILMLQGFRSLNSIVLIALPLFILTGYLMEASGLATRLLELTTRMAHGRGRLGATIVLASAVFGAIAGTATAAVAAMGTMIAGPAREQGYAPGYTAALLGVSSLLGILFPPSITLILFAVVTRQSVAALFAATIGPALLLIIGLLIYNSIAVRRLDIPPQAPATTPVSTTILRALPAIFMPVLILGGIYGGVFTPTEAAGVAAMATLLIGVFIYRSLNIASLSRSLVLTAQTTGSIIMILLFSFMISRVLATERIPQDISDIVQSLIDNRLMALLLVNVILIAAGALMDDLSVTVVIAPLFLPAMSANGIDPVHFAAIVACSVVIGSNSPPVAPILYMASKVVGAPVSQAMRASMGIITFVALPVLVVTSLWPDLSLALPRWLGLM